MYIFGFIGEASKLQSLSQDQAPEEQTLNDLKAYLMVFRQCTHYNLSEKDTLCARVKTLSENEPRARENCDGG